MVPTPPVLFMNAEGEVLGEVSNYAPVDKVLAAMQKVLADHPAYAKPSAAEAKLDDPVAKARLALELLAYDAAAEHLGDPKDGPAALLRAVVARRQGDFETARRYLDRVKAPELAPDVRMERAHALWQAKQYKALRDALADFPADARRYTEARYYLGLAHHLLGETKAALDTWASTVKACAQDPWIYKADWAYTNVKEAGSGRRMFSTAGPKTSLLGRHGYMGNQNPDLTGPR